MRVEYSFLCDYAQDHAGKLTAIGIGIDQMAVGALPWTHPLMYLVAQVKYSAAEAGTKALAVRIVDADGANVVPPIDGEIDFASPLGTPQGAIKLVLQFNNVVFNRLGDYEVQLALGGQEIAALPIAVQAAGATA